MLGELFGAESKGQVYGYLYSFVFDNPISTSSLGKIMIITYLTSITDESRPYTVHKQMLFSFTETVCYDDGCHLKRYVCNSSRRAVTTTAGRLASLNYVIDRMHFKGHIDPWCHQHCDPNKFKELESVCFYCFMHKKMYK